MLKARLNLSMISTESFNYKNGAFTAFASDLTGTVLDRNRRKDCFTMKNFKTGGEVLFVETIPTKDQEGDIVCFNFKCLTRDHEKLTVVIFNT